MYCLFFGVFIIFDVFCGYILLCFVRRHPVGCDGKTPYPSVEAMRNDPAPMFLERG